VERDTSPGPAHRRRIGDRIDPLGAQHHQTLHDLQAWNVSLIAQTGLQFELSTPQSKLIASMMAALAEIERDLLRERVRSGIAAAKARGKTFGRRPGHRPKADRLAPKVLCFAKEGWSYRDIAKEVKLSKNTVMSIVHRHRNAQCDATI